MTNLETAWIAGLVLLALILDMVFNSGAATMFLLLKMIDLIEYIKFWD